MKRHHDVDATRMRMVRLACASALALACLLAPTHAHARNAATGGGIDIGGEIVAHRHLAPEDLAKLPRTRVHASAHGVEADFEGVSLIEILRSAGAPGGETLRGPALALYVRITAADGYRAVFALAELDASTGNAQAILADRKNDKLLDGEEGPLRVVVPGDKRPARWVRQVVAIDLLMAPDSSKKN